MSKPQSKPVLGALLIIIGAMTLITEAALALYIYADLTHSARGWGSDTRIIGSVYSGVILLFGLVIGLPVAFGAVGLISGGWVLIRGSKPSSPTT